MVFAQLAQFSPSTKFVLKVLQLNGRMTQKDIILETTLPPRTVKYAIKKLKDSNIVQEKPRLNDMRSKYYIYFNGQNLHL
ncbi:MAG: winged helix-turn-helix domain-containing protein [Methanobacteriota archaeon]